MVTQYICNACGQLGKPNEKLRGNFAAELILWWFFIVPGIIYSYWRRSNKDKVCASCGNKTLIPANTPMGAKLLTDTGQTLSEIKEEKPKNNYALLAVFAILSVAFLIIMMNAAVQK